MISKLVVQLVCFTLTLVFFLTFMLVVQAQTPSSSTTNPPSWFKIDVDKDNKVDRVDFEVFKELIRKYTSSLISHQSTPAPTTIPTSMPDHQSHSTSSSVPAKSPSPSLVIPVTNQSENSQAMGKWIPNPKFDTCSQAEHDSYSVVGPDGKKYPTWHPPTHKRANGQNCTFGHEHGRNPKNSELWKTKQIQQYFYFDANKNGEMDPSEEAVSGLPFGYVNEQMDTYSKSLGQSVMRHEDHVGHKVEYANGEGDLATHQMTKDTSGGVWVGRLGQSGVTKDTGVRCYYLVKAHQGVSSPDAFTNNLHEVVYFADCRHSNTANNQKVSVAQMMAFGKPGGFTSFMPMCGVERRSASQDYINLGTDSMNSQYPSGGGDREIITRECIEKGFLVPADKFSGNLYEAWPASLSISNSSGQSLLSGINLLFDVEDANRYFYPEDLKKARGYNNPVAKTNLGFTMDLCYDTSLQSQGRIARGGACSYATNYGAIKNITWDDPRAAFKGIHRGMYFFPATLNNVGGPEIWYSDPYGKNAKPTPFAGSVKQQMSSKTLQYGRLIGDSLDPRVNDRIHDTGGNTVHAPN